MAKKKKKEEIQEETFEELETPEEEVPEEEVETGVSEEVTETEENTEEVIPRFELKDSKPEESEVSEEEGMMEIVHNGQVFKFDKAKITELAQKGFDYDYKVGPHGKIAQMIEADPELANVVNSYWQGKQTVQQPSDFVVKPISEYESETEWLKDTIKNAQDFYKQPVQMVQQPQNRGNDVATALKMRDPENFDRVLPKMAEYATQLSVADYSRIDSDLGALCQFYDFVKNQEVAKVKDPNKPAFRVRSGGGTSPKANAASPVWELPKDEFQKQIDKVKGL